jgi:hypothetical protein
LFRFKEMKIRIYLGGHSCQLPDQNAMLTMLAYVCDNIGASWQVMDEQKDWKTLEALCNEPGYIWIINDTAWGHLIHDNPYVIIVRDAVWTWPRAKKNCIGRFTQSMLYSKHAAFYLSQALLKQQIIRLHGRSAARVHHVVSDYKSQSAGTEGRNSFAASTWHELAMNDPAYIQHRLPDVLRVDEILQASLSLLETDNDLLLITNRDICLTVESTAILRAYMDFMDVDGCHSDRIDIDTGKVGFKFLSTQQLDRHETYKGTDLFCFRKRFDFDRLLNTPLYIGAGGWDWYWRYVVGNRCPWAVSYHFTHQTNWHTSDNTKENMRVIHEVLPLENPTKLPLW